MSRWTIAIAALAVLAAPLQGCAGDDPETPPVIDDREAQRPISPQRLDSLCVAACERMDGPACQLIPESDLADPRACLSICRDGEFTIAQLECLASLSCDLSPAHCFL